MIRFIIINLLRFNLWCWWFIMAWLFVGPFVQPMLERQQTYPQTAEMHHG